MRVLITHAECRTERRKGLPCVSEDRGKVCYRVRRECALATRHRNAISNIAPKL